MAPRRLRKWSERLTVRATAYVALTIVMFAGFGVLLNINEGRDVILDRLMTRTEDMATFVADLTGSHVAELNAFELEVILEEVTRQRDVRIAEIINPKGHVIADGRDGKTDFLRKSTSPVVLKALASRQKVIAHDKLFIEAAVPVVVADKFQGLVYLRVSLDGLWSAVAHLTDRYIHLAVALIVIAIPLAAFFMARATRQIRRVTSAVGQIADGDLDFEFAESAPGEVGELQAAFNHMKAVLKDNIAENERLALTDLVTGLPNRQAFRRAVKRLVRHDASRGAVMFIDLDHFKKVNDTFGHHVGDQLLKLVSARLDDFFAAYPSADKPVVARLGGDEFTVLLPAAAEAENAELLASRMVKVISHPFSLQGQEIVIGASVGVTMFPDDGRDPDKLLRNADLAMYAAKENGRQTVHLYSPRMEQATVERLKLEGELRKAIANGEFVVFYQPKIACEDGRVVAAEALVRWKHPTRGLLTPAAFLPVAEEAGLVAELSWQVLERAAQEMADLGRGPHPISLAVNLSATQFEQPDFADRVTIILGKSRLPPACLELELTESLAMRDPDRVIKRMAPLKRRGVRLAIDDFGTGYSSLSYLTRLPIDTVKIDGSFIAAARDSANDRALVTTILGMAESLKFQTVAEGVETDADFAFVRQHGATLAQGFLFSPAMPYQEFAGFWRTFGRRGPQNQPAAQRSRQGAA
ncbi:MAG TPA: EAL domain-containing protein [Beijerinckiaceae bacterium]|jgi:diguanylate cyclase (GGDEF)-like protein